MAGDIDQFSQALGRLQAEAENAQRSRQVMHTKVDLLIEQTSAINAKLTRHEERLSALEPKVQVLNDLRARLAGVLLVLTGAWYLGGSFVTEAVKRWWASH